MGIAFELLKWFYVRQLNGMEVHGAIIAFILNSPIIYILLLTRVDDALLRSLSLGPYAHEEVNVKDSV